MGDLSEIEETMFEISSILAYSESIYFKIFFHEYFEYL